MTANSTAAILDATLCKWALLSVHSEDNNYALRLASEDSAPAVFLPVPTKDFQPSFLAIY